MIHDPLPDVARERSATAETTLTNVGMRNIEAALDLSAEQDGAGLTAASIDALLDLLPGPDRGMHMSRLYRMVDALAESPLCPSSIEQLLAQMLDSHANAASSARVRMRFDLLLRRRALVSDLSGWRRYPVHVYGHRRGSRVALAVGFDLLYSSTCPSSAALSRQLIQQHLHARFGDGNPTLAEVGEWLASVDGMPATPHAQRSQMRARIGLRPEAVSFGLARLIDTLEEALGTVVQGPVKRADEQAFAWRNGHNLMFCEDAARRAYVALDQSAGVDAFEVEVRHYESLHPHDATASVRKPLDRFRAAAGTAELQWPWHEFDTV